jgi:membrane-bound serine protease (ClpP class)
MPNSSQAQIPSKKVYVFNMHQEIAPAAVRLVSKAFAEASRLQADYILIRLNTFGGQLDAADSIRTIILNAKIPVLVLIEQNAASAGALISIACDSIYMKKGSTIGAASVVNQNGELMPDKYQSYMRGMMRATAEQNNRDPKIAEGMVTPNGYLKDIADTGRIITLTTDEAIRYKYCNAVANDIEEVMMKAGIDNYEFYYHQTSTLDCIIGFFLNPVVNSILLLLIIGGLYFELQSPGVGFPLIVSIIAAVLYFAPLYLEGLAANWEMLVFIAGVILVILEIFVIPGFGIAGISGIILVVLGLTLSLINNYVFDFSFTAPGDIIYAFLRVTLTIAVAFITGLLFSGKILRSSMFNKVVLTETQENQTAYLEDIQQLNNLKGKTAKAITVLKPSGTVEIDGDTYEALADGTFINAGELVKVIAIRGNYLVVRKH